MHTAIIEGLLTGFGTVIFIGPVLFTLLQITLNKGIGSGMAVASGIIASDIVIVVLFYLGLSDFFTLATTQFWLAASGSMILLGLGIKYILKPSLPQPGINHTNLSSTFGAFSKGFLVNFVNPFVFFVWISLTAYAQNQFNIEVDVMSYLIAILVGIFITDTAKVLLASRVSKLLQPTVLRRIYFIIGLALIAFGLRLIYFIIFQA